ncbi:hypothetical protein PFISCL1PPCAC_6083, partial [Pristionchus fissidentatus]
ALFISFMSYNIAQLLVHFGVNVRVYNFVPGECSTLALSEEEIAATDFATMANQIVFTYISASKKTGIFSFESKNKTATQLRIDFKSMTEFHPEGISVWRDRIFVVNHRSTEDTVEILNLRKDHASLSHLSTVRSKKFDRLRDVVAVDRTKFFATVWRQEKNEFKRFIDEYFVKYNGAVVFFDGTSTRFVDRKISSPYGIVYDKDQKSLFVASYAAQSIISYSVSDSFSISRKS